MARLSPTEVSGVWKDLTDNVNQLATNLTNQVTTMAEVATTVTEGDLTRQVRVEASGEVTVLKDTLNEMIRNLGKTTREHRTGLVEDESRAVHSACCRADRDLAEVSSMILSELAPLVSAQHGVFYSMTNPDRRQRTGARAHPAGYGYEERRHLSTTFPRRRGDRRRVRGRKSIASC